MIEFEKYSLDTPLVPTSHGVPVTDLLLLLVEDRLHAHLLCRARGDVDGVFKAEAPVVVSEKMSNWSVIPANYDGVGLCLEVSKVEKFSQV